MKAAIIAAAAMLATADCAGASTAASTVAVAPDTIAELRLPEVPRTLVTPADRAAYVIAHFWDYMDFADTTRSRNAAFMEQNFANYASLFPHTDIATVLPAAAEALLHSAEADREAYNLLAETAEKYLYETESPMLNEEAYIPFLQAITSGSFIDPALRARYEAQLGDATKNRPGSRATDFAVNLRGGGSSTLHELCKGAKAVLLLFYDPDCGSCTHLVEDMKSDPALSRAVNACTVKIIAVYPDGDEEMWAAGAGKIPAAWVDAISPGGEIVEDELYSIRSTPTIYLLDGEAKVVMKDAPAAEAVAAAIAKE